MTLKMLLWKIGFMGDNCPYCGKKLLAHGFKPNQRWTCLTNDCKFNGDGK